MSVLATKLYIPPLRARTVRRPRLMARLEEGLELGHRLTLISAPAGFGKTTLVAGWMHSRGSTLPAVALTWLSLDENDNDPARFFTYFVAALQKVDPAIGQGAQVMASDALLPSLVNDVAATPQPFVLVLDDYHLIQAPPIHQAMSFLLEHQPPQMLLVIATREDPPLPLSRLRARAQMTDIRQRDLQFNQEEAADFLQATMALELSATDVAILQRRTEGWIAGLQLAALSMQQIDDSQRGQFVADLDGSQRYILDYLVDEVFTRQVPSVQDFMLKTSILDRLTASLCDAVTGRSDSQQVLLALEQANLFIVRLDESRQWYRYHHLFQDLLRTQRVGLDTVALHLRAACWYERKGLLDEAMDHALAAGDWDEAERMMGGAAALVMNNGQFTTLTRWLDALPLERLRGSSELAAIKAWGLLSMGQIEAFETWIELAHELLPDNASGASQAMVVCLQMYLAQFQHNLPQVVELAIRALQLLEEADPYGLRGVALSNLASAQAAMGDLAAAMQTFLTLAQLGQERGLPDSAVTAFSSLAWLKHLQGRAHEAVALGQHALALCTDARGNRLPLAGYPHAALGLIHYDLNELDQAYAHLVQGLSLAGQLGPSTSVIQAAFTLARIQQLRGETETARTTVDNTCRAAARLKLPLADALAAAWEADFALKLGNVEAAARWAERSGQSMAGPPDLVREDGYLTYTRVLLAQKRTDEARALLTQLERSARTSGRVRSLITICILKALAQIESGQKEQALASLDEAVRLAAPEGYGRAFLDQGQAVLALLPGVRYAAPEFVDSLLRDSRTPAAPRRDGRALIQQPLAEPLSERELEVLELVANGLTNQEIAAKLFISVGTVKTHVHNVCGKLAANSRTQAAARGRELGLL